MAMVRMAGRVGSSAFVVLNWTFLGEPIPEQDICPKPSAGHLRILISCCRLGTHHSSAIRDGSALPANAQPSFGLHYAVSLGRRPSRSIHLTPPSVPMDCLVPAALRF